LSCFLLSHLQGQLKTLRSLEATSKMLLASSFDNWMTALKKCWRSQFSKLLRISCSMLKANRASSAKLWWFSPISGLTENLYHFWFENSLSFGPLFSMIIYWQYNSGWILSKNSTFWKAHQSLSGSQKCCSRPSIPRLSPRTKLSSLSWAWSRKVSVLRQSAKSFDPCFWLFTKFCFLLQFQEIGIFFCNLEKERGLTRMEIELSQRKRLLSGLQKFLSCMTSFASILIIMALEALYVPRSKSKNDSFGFGWERVRDVRRWWWVDRLKDFVEFIDGIKELFEVISFNSQKPPTIFCKNFKTIDSSLIINSSCLF